MAKAFNIPNHILSVLVSGGGFRITPDTEWHRLAETAGNSHHCACGDHLMLFALNVPRRNGQERCLMIGQCRTCRAIYWRDRS